MDTASIALGVGLIVLFVGPILYMIFQQSNKDKNKLKNLKSLGSQHNMKLDEIELSNSLILGLDSASKKLIIVEPKNNMQFDIIDLSKIQLSEVTKKGLPQVSGNKEHLAVTHISLELIKNNPKEVVTEIVFYDEDDDTSYDAATQLCLANKWDKLIRTNLSA